MDLCVKDVFPQLYAVMPDVESVFRPTLHLRLPETAAAAASVERGKKCKPWIPGEILRSLSEIAWVIDKQRCSMQWVQSSSVLWMPHLPESLPLEMHRLLRSWVRNFTGLGKFCFTLVIQWMRAGFVCICCFKQLMKQSLWWNENIGWSPGSNEIDGNFVLYFM